MKSQDFERLKAICEKEGFELVTESPKENDKFYVVKKTRQRVQYLSFNYDIERAIHPLVNFVFVMNPIGDLNKAGLFLSQQLEKYLNNEI